MASPIFELCDRYVLGLAALDPIWANARGVVGDFGPAADYSPDGLAAQQELVEDTLRSLAGLSQDPRVSPPATVDGGDRLAALHLRERLEAERAWFELGEPLRNVRGQFGLLDWLRDSVALLPPGSEAVTARVAAVPEMLAGWRESLRLGLSRGLVAARRQVLEAADQADRLAGVVFADLPGNEAARAAYGEVGRYLRQEYAPHAVDADGVGPERYRVASRLSLGADIDPRDAYEWGWAELHRIEDEMTAEAAAILPGASIGEVAARLDQSEVVHGDDAYRGWLQERHDEAIERLDGTHVDLVPGLRRVEVVLATQSTAGAAYYTAPTEDLSRPGRTWWPTNGRERFAIWAELTTVFHEGVPGHHLQLGQARVAADRLSRFSRVAGVSGHSEGWALYAERLADELGWFTGPGRRLGMLKGSALRAARVVIDIGLHLGLPLPPEEARRHGPEWTFEVAEDVLRARGHAGEHRVHPEVVRYCGWPGQAISYKLGERAWLAAREEARQRLGASFDLKRWHTDALALGSVGLDSLAEVLRGIL